VLIKAGTVHSLGDGVMVFEVQENSDVTFRLYDWDHVDAETGKPRDLPGRSGLGVCGLPPRRDHARLPGVAAFPPAEPMLDTLKRYSTKCFRLSWWQL
jgi:hypothetical protein